VDVDVHSRCGRAVCFRGSGTGLACKPRRGQSAGKNIAASDSKYTRN
jgi:hypothetical protein